MQPLSLKGKIFTRTNYIGYQSKSNCMTPRHDLGAAIESTGALNTRDFSSLMPRPGWNRNQPSWEGFL
jgi:hypothetical protein